MSRLWNAALSGRAGYLFAFSAIAFAAALQWLIAPYVGPRAPYVFFLPMIVLTSIFAGRGFGMLVAGAGLINAALLQPPVGSLLMTSGADRVSVFAYALVSLMLVMLGGRVRLAAGQAQDAERRLNVAQEDAAVGLFELDLKRRTILGSAGLWRLLGRPPRNEPAPLTEWFRVVHPDDVAKARWLLEVQPDRDSRMEFEHRVLLPDGAVRWLLSRMRIEHDGHGEAQVLRGVAVDVTERKERSLLLAQTQAELRQQVADLQDLHELTANLVMLEELPEQMRMILQTLSRMHGAKQGLVSIHDRDGDLMRVVASVGFSDAALARLQAVRPGEGACGRACVERQRVIIQDTEREPGFERFRALAAHEGFRAVHSTPLLSHAGELLGALSVHLSTPRAPSEREIKLADICARKAAVFIERERAERLAQQRERSMRSVLGTSAVPFTILTPMRDAAGSIVDFRWSYLNAAAARAIGRPATELLDQSVAKKLPGGWEEAGLFERYVAVAERNEVSEFEMRSGANGVAGWFHVVASPLDGSVAVWFADVTDRKLQEEALREADRRKDEFLATLAHELRNPLAPIRQAALIAGSSAASPAQKEWSHAVIERQVQHMSLLLDDLLDVSRITRGNLQLRKQYTTLAAVLSAAVETVRPLIDAKRHRLVIEAPDAQIAVHADPLRVAQVLSNLLTNAAKYTNPEGLIRLTARVANDELLVQVTDNGIGLNSEELPTVFRMFSQVKAAQDRSEGGLGIGLALTKGLVELHGGVIEASSPGPNAGSTFTVRLPIVVEPQPSGAAAGEVREPRLILTRRILIADDNRDAAESLAALLRLDGHEVFLAHDGESAWRSYVERQPEIGLLDIGMPGLSGYEVAERIRREEGGRERLLVAITGWGQGGDKERAARAGFDHHMTKPVDYDELSRVLQPHRKAAAGG